LGTCRRLTLVILTAVALALTGAGCAKKVPTRKVLEPPAEGQSQTGEKRSIRVLSSMDQQALNALASAFENRYPQYRIERVTPYAAPTQEGLKSHLEREQVDVLPTSFESTGPLVQAGLLAPLDPFIKKSKYDVEGLGPAVAGLRVGGKFYDLPYGLLAMVMMYNVERYESAKLPLPKPGWTWEQLRDDAKRLTNQDLNLFGFSPAEPLHLPYVWGAQRGGARWLDDPNSVAEALRYLATLTHTDRSMPPPFSPGRRDFEEGRVAISLRPVFAFNYMTQQSQAKFDVTLPPALPGGTGETLALPLGLGVTVASQNQDVAWQFVSFAAGPDGAKALARSGFLPMRNSPEIQQAWAGRQPAPSAGTRELIKGPWMVPSSDLLDMEAFPPLEEAVQKTAAGEQTWEAAAAWYARELQQAKAKKK